MANKYRGVKAKYELEFIARVESATCKVYQAGDDEPVMEFEISNTENLKAEQLFHLFGDQMIEKTETELRKFAKEKAQEFTERLKGIYGRGSGT